MKIGIDVIEKFVEETCDLVKKTNNDFSIREKDIKETTEEESDFLTDECSAFNILVSIYNELDDDDIELYSKETKKNLLTDFEELLENLSEDEVENLDKHIEIDMASVKENKESSKKSKPESSKKKGQDVKDLEAMSFFNDVKELTENEDVLIDKDIFSDDLNSSNLVDVINSIIDELDEEDDIDELSEESQSFYKKYKKGYSIKEVKKKSDTKKENKDAKKEKSDKKSKRGQKSKVEDDTAGSKNKDTDEAKKEKPDANANETNKLDEMKTIEGNEGDHKCKCQGEKTLTLKGDPTIIEALTRFLEVISK